MNFLYEYTKDINKSIIHCRAGVGRTGTFIMYRILKKKEFVSLDEFI